MEWTAAAVKALRGSYRLNREEFAELLGASPKSVQNWETGTVGKISPYMQRALDAALSDAATEVRQRFTSAVESDSQEHGGAQRNGPTDDADEIELVRQAATMPTPTTSLAGAREVVELTEILQLQLSRSAGNSELPFGLGVDAYQLTDYLRSWATDVNRRELIRLLGLAATNLAAVPLLITLNDDEQGRLEKVIATPRRVDAQAVGYIETVLHAAMNQDDVLGPQAALDTVLAQRKLTHTLLSECPSQLRRRLLTLYGNVSRFAGWLSFDLGDFETASIYYEQARVAAHEAENADLSSFVLCNMSHLATWRQRPRVGIDHALAAQNWAEDTDDELLRAYAADVAARAYAGAGKDQACLDALDTAQRGLGGGQTHTPATSLVYFYGPGQFAQTRSLCLLQLGQVAEAERAAKESLQLIGRSFVRNQAFATLYLGNAYVAGGEIDQAARVIGDGAVLTARNRSTRLTATLHRARAGLRAWQKTPAVQQLDGRLRTYGLLPSPTT